MSTHIIEIIEIKEIHQHPDPEVERLEVIPIAGWKTCVRKGEFKIGDKAIYIPPDYMVPVNLEYFSFLKDNNKDKTHVRIKAKKIRGIISYGLLIPCPQNLINKQVGYNAIDDLGIYRYEPPEEISTGGLFVSPPDLYAPVFDVENFQNYPDIFKDGETVYISEKIHGTSARFTYTKNKDGVYEQFCGSRRNWFDKNDNKNVYWKAFNQHPAIEHWCKTYPDHILYGEVFGPVQKLHYGAKGNEIFFAAFAVFYKDKFLNISDSLDMVEEFLGPNDSNIDWCPPVYIGKFNKDKVISLASGNTLWRDTNFKTPDQIREGIVILPLIERFDSQIGRVILKVINPDYLIKS